MRSRSSKYEVPTVQISATERRRNLQGRKSITDHARSFVHSFLFKGKRGYLNTGIAVKSITDKTSKEN